MKEFTMFILWGAGFLYLLGGVGFFIQGKWELGGAYVCYALSNVLLARL